MILLDTPNRTIIPASLPDYTGATAAASGGAGQTVVARLDGPVLLEVTRQRSHDLDMAQLASDYAFQWRETESSFIRSVEIPSQKLDLTTSSSITQIVGWFKDRELNVLLEVTYSQTEPMVRASRGDILDFSSIPVDKQMPKFFPRVSHRSTAYALHPERLKRMEALRARAETLKEKARQRMTFRESESYQQAAALMKEEFTAPDRLPDMSGSMTFDAAKGFATG